MMEEITPRRSRRSSSRNSSLSTPSDILTPTSNTQVTNKSGKGSSSKKRLHGLELVEHDSDDDLFNTLPPKKPFIRKKSRMWGNSLTLCSTKSCDMIDSPLKRPSTAIADLSYASSAIDFDSSTNMSGVSPLKKPFNKLKKNVLNSFDSDFYTSSTADCDDALDSSSKTSGMCPKTRSSHTPVSFQQLDNASFISPMDGPFKPNVMSKNTLEVQYEDTVSETSPVEPATPFKKPFRVDNDSRRKRFFHNKENATLNISFTESLTEGTRVESIEESHKEEDSEQCEDETETSRRTSESLASDVSDEDNLSMNMSSEDELAIDASPFRKIIFQEKTLQPNSRATTASNTSLKRSLDAGKTFEASLPLNRRSTLQGTTPKTTRNLPRTSKSSLASNKSLNRSLDDDKTYEASPVRNKNCSFRDETLNSPPYSRRTPRASSTSNESKKSKESAIPPYKPSPSKIRLSHTPVTSQQSDNASIISPMEFPFKPNVMSKNTLEVQYDDTVADTSPVEPATPFKKPFSVGNDSRGKGFFRNKGNTTFDISYAESSAEGTRLESTDETHIEESEHCEDKTETSSRTSDVSVEDNVSLNSSSEDELTIEASPFRKSHCSFQEETPKPNSMATTALNTSLNRSLDDGKTSVASLPLNTKSSFQGTTPKTTRNLRRTSKSSLASNKSMNKSLDDGKTSEASPVRNRNSSFRDKTSNIRYSRLTPRASSTSNESKKSKESAIPPYKPSPSKIRLSHTPVTSQQSDNASIISPMEFPFKPNVMSENTLEVQYDDTVADTSPVEPATPFKKPFSVGNDSRGKGFFRNKGNATFDISYAESSAEGTRLESIDETHIEESEHCEDKTETSSRTSDVSVEDNVSLNSSSEDELTIEASPFRKSHCSFQEETPKPNSMATTALNTSLNRSLDGGKTSVASLPLNTKSSFQGTTPKTTRNLRSTSKSSLASNKSMNKSLDDGKISEASPVRNRNSSFRDETSNIPYSRLTTRASLASNWSKKLEESVMSKTRTSLTPVMSQQSDIASFISPIDGPFQLNVLSKNSLEVQYDDTVADSSPVELATPFRKPFRLDNDSRRKGFFRKKGIATVDISYAESSTEGTRLESIEESHIEEDSDSQSEDKTETSRRSSESSASDDSVENNVSLNRYSENDPTIEASPFRKSHSSFQEETPKPNSMATTALNTSLNRSLDGGKTSVASLPLNTKSSFQGTTPKTTRNLRSTSKSSLASNKSMNKSLDDGKTSVASPVRNKNSRSRDETSKTTESSRLTARAASPSNESRRYDESVMSPPKTRASLTPVLSQPLDNASFISPIDGPFKPNILSKNTLEVQYNDTVADTSPVEPFKKPFRVDRKKGFFRKKGNITFNISYAESSTEGTRLESIEESHTEEDSDQSGDNAETSTRTSESLAESSTENISSCESKDPFTRVLNNLARRPTQQERDKSDADILNWFLEMKEKAKGREEKRNERIQKYLANIRAEKKTKLVPDGAKNVRDPPVKLIKPGPWANRRLYNFLSQRLFPHFGVKSNLKAEEIVVKINDCMKVVTKRREYQKTPIEKLKTFLAEHKIVGSTSDFHQFVGDFLPFEFVEKVIPCVQPFTNIVWPPHDNYRMDTDQLF